MRIDRDDTVYEERIPEDRLAAQQRRKKKRRNNTISSILVMFGCLIVLVLVTYVAGVLYMWIDDEFQQSANDIAAAVEEADMEDQTMYNQAQLDAYVAEAVARTEKEVTAKAREEVLAELKEELTTKDSTVVEALRQVYQDDLIVYSKGDYHFVPIQQDLKMHGYQSGNLQIAEDGEYTYVENGQVISHKGIDVSKFQGQIDWDKVVEDDVEFAFIRAGYRGYGTEGKLVADEMFDKNVKGAINAGIKVGAYFYTQATNDAEVLEEASMILDAVGPYRIECPIVIDVELVGEANGRMNNISKEERTRLVKLFCDTIKAAGYTPMIYYNMEMGALYLNVEELEEYDKWFANYRNDFYYPYDYDVWQYSAKGRVDGIKGDVDMNIAFEPLWD